MSEKEKEIQRHIEVLGITREEAEQLWLEDNTDFVSKEMAEMEEKAKTLKRRYEGDTKQRKQITREKKLDDNKVKIIKELYEYIKEVLLFENTTIANAQREITFVINNEKYSLVLTKHRK